MKNKIKMKIIKKLLKEKDKKISLSKPHQKKNIPIKEKKQINVIMKIKKLFLNKRKS